MASDKLNVIAMISGGKDSFFSLLHCMQHGHRIVALANLFPGEEGTTSAETQTIQPDQALDAKADVDQDQHGGAAAERDLNSFMYQTVGHEIIPLYAAATGLPLYRQPILGGAVRHERDYDAEAKHEGDISSSDETESMLPLIRTVMAHHPEANALCAGAILSTYQRTRVESVALRLGLVPLAYLWKYPVLPTPPSLPADETQLLKDMAAASLEARIIKVASAGLGEEELWQQVSSAAGADRVKRALRRFGVAEGAALGEGGEFETVVVDGPAALFKKRIEIPAECRLVVNEGGGSTWLMLKNARLEEKEPSGPIDPDIRLPELLDPLFRGIQDALRASEADSTLAQAGNARVPKTFAKRESHLAAAENNSIQWCVVHQLRNPAQSVELETMDIVEQIRHLLSSHSLDVLHITNTIIVLREMSDFPKINTEYGKLFQKPNPPSRVTISCGNLLPAGCNIAVYLTALNSPAMPGERDGLHVQSRSYWAPANIGPYSQAISFPIASTGASKSLIRATSVAGQIPLIPACMTLPPPSETAVTEQTVLSLQHLWRIGIETKIQFWSSAVAYFARTSSSASIESSAKVAGRAWRLVHEPRDEDDEEADGGPDLWDRKYNPEFMSLGADSHDQKTPTLPDWSILTLEQQNNWEVNIPPLFAVEVEELPRGAAVEWHAHLGLSGIDEGRAEVIPRYRVGSSSWLASHTVARLDDDDYFIHTVLHCGRNNTTDGMSLDAIEENGRVAYAEALGQIHGPPVQAVQQPYLAYVDRAKLGLYWDKGAGANDMLPFPTVPCHSLWSTHGERLDCILHYTTSCSLR